MYLVCFLSFGFFKSIQGYRVHYLAIIMQYTYTNEIDRTNRWIYVYNIIYYARCINNIINRYRNTSKNNN